MQGLQKTITIIVLTFESTAIVVIGAFLVVTKTTQPYLLVPATVEAIIVPGAGVLTNGDLSPVLQDRVNTAIHLYQSGIAKKILVSGDNSTLSHNEVNPMSNYLIKNGVPAEDIFLDHAGFDTYSTMYRARYIFGVTSAVIATQSFHLPRAIYLARALGIDAYGANADNGSYLFSNYSHEWFSDVKAIFDVLTERQSKYLGATIPITGDGTQTQ